MQRERVRHLEVLGLSPLGEGLRQCRQALLGDGIAPPAKWGPSALRIFRPRISLPLWLGRTRKDRKVIIYQLPNRARPPRDDGYSVRISFCRDFRGRRMSYDGHQGTDFATPPGTHIVAAAPGIVRFVRKDMQRGGLKVGVDHGSGLFTMSNHLSRAWVKVGQQVRTGDTLGLSGMSGVDGVLFSPWLAPHLHFDVYYGGEVVDPFAAPGEQSLWHGGNHPVPWREEPVKDLAPHSWNAEVVDELVASCRDSEMRARLQSMDSLDERAFWVTVERAFSHWRFAHDAPLGERPTRRPLLHLPFRAQDYDGVIYADEM